MTEFRADLHCHSTCSDGTLHPEEIVRLAVDSGLKGLSITDHDSIDAYPLALPLAEELGLEMISGAEFSSIHKDVSVHILAYAFSLESSIIHDFCQRHNQRRESRNRGILALLAKHGMTITEEEIAACTPNNLPHARRTVGRPHIAQAMIRKGYVLSVNEAFKKWLAEGKPCYAQGESFTAEETIDIIHQAKGLAVIAHPHLINHPNTLQDLLKMKFDGIECYYAQFSLQQQKRWLKIAEKQSWLITGGSDFHGDIKPNIALGCSWVPEEIFRKIQKHYIQAQL